ncbi:MAG: MFS transporter [Lacisediminihabitans sp.]
MTLTSDNPLPTTVAGTATTRPRGRRTVSRGVAFTVFALTLVVLFASSAAPSPFFVLYQQEWGFPSWLLTFAFAIYALTLLIALLTVGSLSDHIGRRPVLIGALVLQVAAMALFAFAPNIETVVLARALQGIATGAATGALSAGLTDLATERNKAIGLTVISLAPVGGLAVGAIAAGVLIQSDASPIPTTFLAFAAAFVLALVFVVISPESVSGRPGALRSLRPHVSVPALARVEFRAALPVFLAGWMVGGLFLGLVPEILRDTFHLESGLVSGGAIAVLSGVGALSIYLSRRVRARRVIVSASVALVAGITIFIVAVVFESLALFGPIPFVLLAIGTVFAGVGFGMAFAGEMRVIAPLAEAHQRAELFAATYIVCYLSLGLPAIIAGLAIGTFHLVPTTIGYALIIIASAAIGAIAHALRGTRLSPAAASGQPS